MNELDKYKLQPKNDITEFVSTVITDLEGRPLILKRSETLKIDPR